MVLVKPDVTKVIIMSHFNLGRTGKGEVEISQYVITHISADHMLTFRNILYLFAILPAA